MTHHVRLSMAPAAVLELELEELLERKNPAPIRRPRRKEHETR